MQFKFGILPTRVALYYDQEVLEHLSAISDRYVLFLSTSKTGIEGRLAAHSGGKRIDGTNHGGFYIEWTPGQVDNFETLPSQRKDTPTNWSLVSDGLIFHMDFSDVVAAQKKAKAKKRSNRTRALQMIAKAEELLAQAQILLQK